MLVRKEATLADLKDFRDWLKDQSGEYDPSDPSNCLVCQFMKARGFHNPQFNGTDLVRYTHGPDDRIGVMLPKTIAEIAYGKNNMDLDGDFEYTFEAAQKRAEKVIRAYK